jgi:hypothetical protein
MRQIAVVNDYAEFVAALRQRKEELQVSFATLDAVSGLPDGLASKIMAPSMLKGLGMRSLGPMLQTLALAVVIVEDSEELERLRHRLQPMTEADQKRVASNERTRQRKDAAQPTDGEMPSP